MKVTSAAANKMLRKLNEDYQFMVSMDNKNCTYTEVQDVTPIIPEYDIDKNTENLRLTAKKISALKHAISVFNTTTKLPDHDYTIDEALVRMSFLSREKERLDKMRRMPKRVLDRRNVYGSKQIEYEVANFDPAEAEKLYTEVSDELQKLQLALDTVNSTEKFEVDA